MKHTRSRCNKVFSGILMTAAFAAVIFSILFLLYSNRILGDSLTEAREELENLQNHAALLEEKLDSIENPVGGVSQHGPLKASGGKLWDANGSPCTLRGLSSHGLLWFPEYTNYAAMKTLKDNGANVFRIAVYVQQNMSYSEQPALNKKLLYSAVENARAADLYSIVDWHVLHDQNPLKNLDLAIEFFREVSDHFGDDPSVIYEICNEPNGDTTYEDIRKYASAVIPVIRENAPNALILVGTPAFSSRLDLVTEHPLRFDNLAYTLHYYTGISDAAHSSRQIQKAIDKGLTVFVTEWGMDSTEATEKSWEETNAFLSFLDDNQVSWVNWSLCNKQEGYSVLKDSTDTLGAWSPDELTRIGNFVFSHLRKAAGLDKN